MLNSLSYSPGAKLLENTMTTAKQQQHKNLIGLLPMCNTLQQKYVTLHSYMYLSSLFTFKKKILYMLYISK